MALTVVYENTSSCVSFLYSVETTVDTGLGVCMLVLWSSVFLLSLFLPQLMSEPDNGGLGPTLVFYILGSIALLGTVYMLAFIREVKGLTEQ